MRGIRQNRMDDFLLFGITPAMRGIQHGIIPDAASDGITPAMRGIHSEIPINKGGDQSPSLNFL